MLRQEGPASVGHGAHPTVQRGAPERGGALNGSGAVKACWGGGTALAWAAQADGDTGARLHTRRADGGEAPELLGGAAAATAAAHLQDGADEGRFVCRGGGRRSRGG